MHQLQLVARYVVHPGEEEKVRSLLRQLATASAAEPGNLAFDAYVSFDDPRRIVLLERYVDSDALAAHRETPHFRDLVLDQIVPLLDSRVLETYTVEDEQ